MKKRISLSFNKNLFLDFMSIICFVYSSFFAFIIYTHIDTNGNLLANKVNFASFNQMIDDFFLNFFRFDKSSKDKEVDIKVNYLEQGEHTFTSEDEQIRMLGEGTISYTSLENDKTYAVLVSYGEVIASYFNVINPLVKSGDHLLKGETLGTYDQCFKVYFQANQEYISYTEALTKI